MEIKFNLQSQSGDQNDRIDYTSEVIVQLEKTKESAIAAAEHFFKKSENEMLDMMEAIIKHQLISELNHIDNNEVEFNFKDEVNKIDNTIRTAIQRYGWDYHNIISQN